MNGVGVAFLAVIAVADCLATPRAGLADVFAEGNCAHVATAVYTDCSRFQIFRCEAKDGVLFRYEALEDDSHFSFVWDERTDDVSVVMDGTADDGTIRMDGNRVADAINAGRVTFNVGGEVRLMGIIKPLDATITYQYSGTKTTISGTDFDIVAADVVALPPPPMTQISANMLIAHDPASGLSVVKEATLDDGSTAEDATLDLERILFPGQTGFADPVDPLACERFGQVLTTNIRTLT